MHFCFKLGEVLGVVDPRTLFDQMDSELMALWLAYFGLKNQQPDSGSHSGQRQPIYKTVDQQVSACERMLL